jgi:chromosome segregation ATPase
MNSAGVAPVDFAPLAQMLLVGAMIQLDSMQQRSDSLATDVALLRQAQAGLELACAAKEEQAARVASELAEAKGRLAAADARAQRQAQGEEGAQAEEAEFNKRLAAIRERFSMTENAPPPPEAQQELMALQQEYQRWLEGVRRRDEKLGAEQFEQGYRELVAAVETVSEKESIDIVFRFYPTAREFKAERMGEAQEFIATATREREWRSRLAPKVYSRRESRSVGGNRATSRECCM